MQKTEAAPRLTARHLSKAVLSVLIILTPVLWVLDVPRELGIALYTEQVVVFVYGAALGLCFLNFDRRGQSNIARPAWYDLAAALCGMAAALYVAVRYPTLVDEIVYRPVDGIVVAVILIVLTVEGVRRTAGLSLAIIIVAFILYALIGHLIPIGVPIRSVDPSRLAVYLGVDTNALIGTPLQVGIVIILPFILLGQLLNRSGGADFFTDLALGLMGRYRGGAGKMAVVGSALFGSISGSAVANVVGTGIVTIPLMKRSGFPAPMAGAVEAVASTGGQLMPPVMGAAAFLMAEFLEVSYGEVLIAALVPSLLYYGALFVQVDLYAAKRGIATPPGTVLPALLGVLRQGWHFVLPFAVFLVALFFLNVQPGKAALWAAAVLVVGSMIFGYRGARPTLRGLASAALWTGSACVEILMITAGAGLVIGVLNLTGLAFSLSLSLLAASGNDLAILLLMTAAISIVLGMGMPTVGVYVLLATLIAPALVKAGVLPMAAHMFVLYFGMMSMVTPPVAIAAFAAAGIAEADSWRTGWAAARLGWSAYIVPFLFVLSPTLLLIGDAGAVAWAVVTAMGGVALTSIGVAGYLFTPLSVLSRVLFVIAGIGLLAPADVPYSGGLVAEAVCLVVAAVLVMFNWRAKRDVAPTVAG
jgi:TRAP transporter 4TM/12TM fusion protein